MKGAPLGWEGRVEKQGTEPTAGKSGRTPGRWSPGASGDSKEAKASPGQGRPPRAWGSQQAAAPTGRRRPLRGHTASSGRPAAWPLGLKKQKDTTSQARGAGQQGRDAEALPGSAAHSEPCLWAAGQQTRPEHASHSHSLETLRATRAGPRLVGGRPRGAEQRPAGGWLLGAAQAQEKEARLGARSWASVTRESLIFPWFLPLPVRRSLSAPNTVCRDKAQRQVHSWPPGPDGLLENRRKRRRCSAWQAEVLAPVGVSGSSHPAVYLTSGTAGRALGKSVTCKQLLGSGAEVAPGTPTCN